MVEVLLNRVQLPKNIDDRIIFNYQTNNMEQTLPQIKVIVVGASGVGKSSILFRFVNDEFNEFS